MKGKHNPMKRTYLILMAGGLFGCLVSAALPSAFPQEKGNDPLSVAGTSKQQLGAFLHKLQVAVAGDSPTAAARLVRYPLLTANDKHSIHIENAQQFVKFYPQIFGPDLKRIIADAATDKVFANSSGVMLGDGQIWLRVVNDELKIITINGSILVEDDKENVSGTAFKVHPQVFNMITCWVSDTETPVVTEINLDAVRRNGNQFLESGLKQKGKWIEFTEKDGEGFKRYQVLEARGNHYTVEYQENSGGTYTSSCIIKFSVEKREVLKNGKQTTIRVLRVLAYASQ